MASPDEYASAAATGAPLTGYPDPYGRAPRSTRGALPRGTPGIAPSPRGRSVNPFSGGGVRVPSVRGSGLTAPAGRIPADLSGDQIDYGVNPEFGQQRVGVLAKPNVLRDVIGGLIGGASHFLQARQQMKLGQDAQTREDALQARQEAQRQQALGLSMIGTVSPEHRQAVLQKIISGGGLGGLPFGEYNQDEATQRAQDAAEIRRMAPLYSNPAPILDAADARAAGKPVQTYPGGGAQPGPPELGLSGAFREAGPDRESRIEEARLALDKQRAAEGQAKVEAQQRGREQLMQWKLAADKGNKDALLKFKYGSIYAGQGGDMDPANMTEWVSRMMAREGEGPYATPSAPALPGFGQTGATPPPALRGWQGGAGASPGTIDQPNFFPRGTSAQATIGAKNAAAELSGARADRFRALLPEEIDRLREQTGLTRERRFTEAGTREDRIANYKSMIAGRDARTKYEASMAGIAAGRLELDEKKQLFEVAKDANARRMKDRTETDKAVLQERGKLLDRINSNYENALKWSKGDATHPADPKAAAAAHAAGDAAAQNLHDFDANHGFSAGGPDPLNPGQTLPPSTKGGATTKATSGGTAWVDRHVARWEQLHPGLKATPAVISRIQALQPSQ